jgi:hypothetical protein
MVGLLVCHFFNCGFKSSIPTIADISSFAPFFFTPSMLLVAADCYRGHIKHFSTSLSLLYIYYEVDERIFGYFFINRKTSAHPRVD